MRLENKNFETFGDGLLSVHKIKGRVIVDTIKDKIPFGDRTIGITRFSNAGVVGAKISRLVSVPINDFINKDNIITIDEFQYTIYQIQVKYDKKPPCLYLSLENANIEYIKEAKKNG